MLPLGVHVGEGVLRRCRPAVESPQKRGGLGACQDLVGCKHCGGFAGGDPGLGHPRHRRVEIVAGHITEPVTLSSFGPVRHVPQKQRHITARHRRVGRETHTIQTRYRIVTRPLHRLNEIVAVAYITIPSHRTSGGGQPAKKPLNTTPPHTN